MKNDNLVSIITPAHNSSLYIKEMIKSIINQTYKNWELLITDDYSSDNTIEIIESYIVIDSRIKLYHLSQNSGASVARNNSIKNAIGRFIAFCDSDDYWASDKLEKQIPFMLEKQTTLSYSNYNIVNENGELLGECISPKQVTYNDMIRTNYIGCLTAIYDSERIGKVYMEDIKARQDWVLWLSILKKEGTAFCFPQKLAFYRKRKKSISGNKLRMIKYHWLVYYKHENFSFLKSILHLFQNLFAYFRKES